MKKINPFPNSLDNKRYHTWNYYLKQTFQSKVFKVSLNANFSCPNRDGTCGYGGCVFCGSLGSGEYAGNIHDDLNAQYENIKQVMLRKWPTGKPLAYFQAYTNTYASLDTLKEVFTPFVEKSDNLGIAIATRADCLEDDKIAYLESLCDTKEIWIELGLQSIYDETATFCNRGHDYATFVDCIQRLSGTRLKVCVHLINSLPYETQDMMIESAKALACLPIHALKIHMLHICEGTQLAMKHKKQPFTLQTRDEYIDTVIKQLEVIPSNMVIQRLTGDGVADDLIAPTWSLNKTTILNDIDKEMVIRNTWQGKYAKAH